MQRESLEEFLEHYDPYKYRTPSCTTDAVIFCAGTSDERAERNAGAARKALQSPEYRFLGASGRIIEMRENLDDTARQELLEETSVDGLVMEQIGTYGDYDRDPRTRVITTAYMAVLQGEERQVRAGDDAADAVVRSGIGGNICADRRRTNGRRCEWNKAGRWGICYRVYPPM